MLIFTDSEEIFLSLIKDIGPELKIKTLSPKLLYKYPEQCLDLGKRWDFNRSHSFIASTNEFLHELFNKVESLDEFKPYALTVSKMAINFQRIIYSAGCLESVDAKTPVTFYKLKTTDNYVNPPWEEFFKGIPEFKVIEVPETKKKVYYNLSTNIAPLKNRLFLGGIETFFYRLSVKIAKKLVTRFRLNYFFILRENELIIETAGNLFTRGVLSSELHLDETPHTPEKFNFPELFKAVEPVIKERLDAYVAPEFHDSITRLFYVQIEDMIQKQSRFQFQWKHTLAKLKYKKAAIASNAPHRPYHMALSIEAAKLNIPFIGFQHGVTHEIADDHHFQAPYYETNLCDHFMTFNEEMSRISDYRYVKKGTALTTGLPKRYINANKGKSMFTNAPDIAFISTNLSAGYLGAVNCEKSDFEKSLLEMKYLKILNKLDKKIFYKSYPFGQRRYPDVDFTFDELENMKNIEVYDQAIDFRYLIPNFKIFIATQATSTLSWVLLSDKPFVFLMDKGVAPLKPELISMFEKSVFFFHSEDPELETKLLSLLSKPIEIIEKDWFAMKTARSELTRIYFTDTREGGGKRAARFIKKLYKN